MHPVQAVCSLRIRSLPQGILVARAAATKIMQRRLQRDHENGLSSDLMLFAADDTAAI